MKTRLLSVVNSFVLTVLVAACAPLMLLFFAHAVTPLSVLIVDSAAFLLIGLRSASRFRALRRFAEREQANLGAIADGMADLRRGLDETWGVIEDERNNLGQVADAVHHLSVQASASASLSERLDLLDGRLDEQSRNLGLVAGAVDELRQAGVGVDLVQGRYAALSDSIVDIAAHVDVLSRTILSREDAGPDAARLNA